MPGAFVSWFHRKRTRETALVACFLLPALAIFFLYRILPLGWNVWLSFHSWSPLKAAKWIGVEHYEEMLLDDDVFWDALTNTLIFIGCSPIAQWKTDHQSAHDVTGFEIRLWAFGMCVVACDA